MADASFGRPPASRPPSSPGETFEQREDEDGVADQDWRTPPLDRVPAPLLGIVYRKGDLRLSVFSTITTFGTPPDVTLQEMRIECFFPADEATRALLSGGGGGG